MNKNLRKNIVIMLIISMVLSIAPITDNSVNASTYKRAITHYGKTKIGETTFKSKANGDTYDIVKIKNGKNKIILKDVGSRFITNGKKIYYTKNNIKLYSYNVKSKKSKLILKVKNDGYTCVTPENAKGKYIYYIKHEGVDQTLYVYNTKTKTNTEMEHRLIDKVTVKGNRVCVKGASLDTASPTYYAGFTLAGKKITSYTKWW
jgi:hypothetical protein